MDMNGWLGKKKEWRKVENKKKEDSEKRKEERSGK